MHRQDFIDGLYLNNHRFVDHEIRFVCSEKRIRFVDDRQWHLAFERNFAKGKDRDTRRMRIPIGQDRGSDALLSQRQ